MAAAALLAGGLSSRPALAAHDPKVRKAVERGLEWVAKSQNRIGRWDASNQYRVPMTALAGIALLGEGSTTTQGKYAENIRRATNYLVSQSRDNGLIGIPDDHRYTYGHGFSMLFLSQVLGEEEDIERRKTLTDVLTRAVKFSGQAQTPAGGWGYVERPRRRQLRRRLNHHHPGARPARLPQRRYPRAKEIIQKAIGYIHNCTMPDGGVCYSSQSRGSSRPAITAAAVACLFNAGEYESEYVTKLMKYCKSHLYNIQSGARSYGHWHYTYYYYAQALYRVGGDEWLGLRDKLFAKLLREQSSTGNWTGNIGPIYVTSLNLTMLQLENGYLPIYQR